MRLDVATLAALEAALARASRPCAFDDLPAGDDVRPELLRNNPQALVLNGVPLRLRLGEFAQAAGARITTCFGAVPDPPADIFLISQEAADRRRRPAVADAPAALNALTVEHLYDRGNRLAFGEGREDPLYDRRLSWLDHHPVALRAWLSAAVHAHLAHRHGSITIRRLTDDETAGLLPLLSAQGLFSEIIEIQLVDDAAHLEAELRVVVVTVEAVCAGHDPHAVESEVGVEGEQEMIVAGQPREIVDENRLELTGSRSSEKSLQTRTVLQRA